MLVSTVIKLVTIVEFVAIRDLEATHVKPLFHHGEELLPRSFAFFFRLPELRRVSRGCGGGYLYDGLTAADQYETLTGFCFGDAGLGILLKLLHRYLPHGDALWIDCTTRASLAKGEGALTPGGRCFALFSTLRVFA